MEVIAYRVKPGDYIRRSAGSAVVVLVYKVMRYEYTGTVCVYYTTVDGKNYSWLDPYLRKYTLSSGFYE
jgi:hypothetical protein